MGIMLWPVGSLLDDARIENAFHDLQIFSD